MIGERSPARTLAATHCVARNRSKESDANFTIDNGIIGNQTYGKGKKTIHYGVNGKSVEKAQSNDIAAWLAELTKGSKRNITKQSLVQRPWMQAMLPATRTCGMGPQGTEAEENERHESEKTQ
jgi:V8-like Glu-specific endopeptidase